MDSTKPRISRFPPSDKKKKANDSFRKKSRKEQYKEHDRMVKAFSEELHIRDMLAWHIAWTGKISQEYYDNEMEKSDRRCDLLEKEFS